MRSYDVSLTEKIKTIIDSEFIKKCVEIIADTMCSNKK